MLRILRRLFGDDKDKGHGGSQTGTEDAQSTSSERASSRGELLVRAENVLLTRFLKPSPIHGRYFQSEWQEAMGRPYMETIRGLVATGALRGPTVREGLEFAGVNDIKPVLRARDLKVSGRKAELIDRLVENAPADAEKLSADMAQDVFVVTDAGRERALSFEHEKKSRRAEAERQVRQMLKEGDVWTAERTVAEFRVWLPPFMRGGLNMDWEGIAKGIYEPSDSVEQIEIMLEQGPESHVVEGLAKNTREALLLLAAEAWLWSKSKADTRKRIAEISDSIGQLDKPIETYVDLIQSWAHSAQVNKTQKEFSDKSQGTTRVWKTMVDEHVCEICASLESAPDKYWRNRFPEGPPAHDGCRCLITLSVDFIEDEATVEHNYRKRQESLRKDGGWRGHYLGDEGISLSDLIAKAKEQEAVERELSDRDRAWLRYNNAIRAAIDRGSPTCYIRAEMAELLLEEDKPNDAVKIMITAFEEAKRTGYRPTVLERTLRKALRAAGFNMRLKKHRALPGQLIETCKSEGYDAAAALYDAWCEAGEEPDSVS